MDKDKQEQQNQRKSEDLFNSVTNKVKPENQNQTHNSRREGMGPKYEEKTKLSTRKGAFLLYKIICYPQYVDNLVDKTQYIVMTVWRKSILDTG